MVMDSVIDRRCYQYCFDAGIADGYLPEVRNEGIWLPTRERCPLFNEFQGDRRGVFFRDIEKHNGFSVYGIVRFRSFAGESPVLDRFGMGIGACFCTLRLPIRAGIHVGACLVWGAIIVKRDIVGVFLSEHVAPEDDRLAKLAPACIFFVSEFSRFSAHNK